MFQETFVINANIEHQSSSSVYLDFHIGIQECARFPDFGHFSPELAKPGSLGATESIVWIVNALADLGGGAPGAPSTYGPKFLANLYVGAPPPSSGWLASLLRLMLDPPLSMSM